MNIPVLNQCKLEQSLISNDNSRRGLELWGHLAAIFALVGGGGGLRWCGGSALRGVCVHCALWDIHFEGGCKVHCAL